MQEHPRAQIQRIAAFLRGALELARGGGERSTNRAAFRRVDQAGFSRCTQAVAYWVSSAVPFRSSFCLICSR